MRVHHFTAVLSPRDAVGYHTLAVDDLLRSMGHRTELFAASVHPDLSGRARHYHESEPGDADVLIYQASTGSPVADRLLARREPLILNYHNLTPAEAFDPWEPHVGAELDSGRRQLARLARRAVAAVADSRFNADELVSLGLEDVRVSPVLFASPVKSAPRTGDGERKTVLFVGRLAPNKRQQDLIAAMAELSELRNGVSLVLVGAASSQRYEDALKEYADRVAPGMVEFCGSVTQSALVDLYSRADVFACLSDHEGFCVPVIEAMAAGVPVLARAAAVLPETVGSAGLLLDEPTPSQTARAIDRVLSDELLRNEMTEKGRRRAADFNIDRSTESMRATLTDLIADLS